MSENAQGTTQQFPPMDATNPPDAAPSAPAPVPDAPSAPSGRDATTDMLSQQNLSNPNPAAQHGAGGLGGRVRAFGKGFVLGGIPGAIAGAASPDFVNQQFEQRKQLSAAGVSQAQADAGLAIANAAKRNWEVEHLDEQHQLEITKSDTELGNKMLSYGLSPKAVIADDPKQAMEQAKTMLGTSSAPFVLHVGDPKARQFMVFDLNDVASNTAVMGDVNLMTSVGGASGHHWTVEEWRNPKMADMRKKDSAALQGFWSPSDPKNLAKYQTYLQTAQNLSELTSPNKNEAVQKAKNAVDMLSKSQANSVDLAGQKAGAVAAAQHPFKMAENAAKYAALNSSRGIWAVDPTSGKPVATTWGAAQQQGLLPPTAEKDLAPYLKVATDAEKSYQQFQDAYADFKKGTKTGAQSMLALSQHLATTFGGVKGNRITKEMIQEHLGARGISDSALVATQRLSNGDALSPDQWDAFRGLITQSRQLSWGNFAVNSSAVGLNMRSWVPKDLGGEADINDVRKTLLTAPQPGSNKTTVVPKGTPKAGGGKSVNWVVKNGVLVQQ